MTLRLVLLSFSLMALAGCADMSKSMQASGGVGRIEKNQSTFDGRTEVSMQPAFIKIDGEGTWTSKSLKGGLSWFSDSPDDAVLTIEIAQASDKSSADWQTIESVDLNVNGIIDGLEPLDVVTDLESDSLTDTSCSAYGCSSGMDIDTSSKRFRLPMSTLKQMLNANEIKIRVSDGKEYFVGDIKAPYTGTVTLFERLPEFLSTVGG